MLGLLVALLIPKELHGQQQNETTEQLPPEEIPQVLEDPPNPEIVRQLVEEHEAAEKKKAEELARKKAIALKAKSGLYNACSCVSYARWLSGINVYIPKRQGQTLGWAKDHPTNSSEPKVGGLIVFWDGKYGHLAVVIAINGDSITIKESNYTRCGLSTRVIPKSSPNIKGFFNI